jgi:hypothetical protein
MDGTCDKCVLENNTKTRWRGYLKQRDQLEDLDVEGKIILKEEVVRTGLMWFIIGRSGHKNELQEKKNKTRSMK